MTTELCDLTGSELASKIAASEVSATEVVESSLHRIEAVDDQVPRVPHGDAGGRPGARMPAGRRFAATGAPHPAVAGIPLALKDVLRHEGISTTCGSRILDNYVPPYDCDAVGPSARRGSVLAGQDELRRVRDGLVHRELRLRPVRNPWDLDRVPGGSSGGSAAAVAAGEVVWRSAPIPAARSASPPPCAASSG